MTKLLVLMVEVRETDGDATATSWKQAEMDDMIGLVNDGVLLPAGAEVYRP